MMYKLVNGLVLVNTEDRLIPPDRISRKNNTKAYQTRYDYNITIMESPKLTTDNRFKK